MSNRFPTRRALAGQQSKSGPKYQPSNDNAPRNRPLKMPGRPLPANDNFPGRLPKAPAGIPPRLYRRLAKRMLLRGIPIIGWAWTAWELYNLWKDWQGYFTELPPYGWNKVAEWDPDWADPYWSQHAEWGATKIWTYQGYLGGVSRNNAQTPTTDAFPEASPHYWWKKIEYDVTVSQPYNGVASRWERDYSVPDEYILPPRPVFIPFGSPVPFGVPMHPLAPMPVPVPKPIRLPGISFPGDPHNVDADGYNDPGLKYRRKPKPSTNPVQGEQPSQARRPRRKEKERKVTGSKKHLKFLGWILSQYSEIGDLVDALHGALPKELQVNGPMNAKLKALYEHWDKVDMTQAVQNMVEDMVTDPKWAGVFEEMQERQEEFGLDLGGLKGLEGSSGIWPTIR